MKVKLPNPCNQDFSNMPNIGNGKFCSECNKIIVDFTKMELPEIKNYFLDKNNTEICGIFKQLHIEQKKSILKTILSEVQYAINTAKTNISLISMIISFLNIEIKAQPKKIEIDTYVDANKIINSLKYDSLIQKKEEFSLEDTIDIRAKKSIISPIIIKGRRPSYQKSLYQDNNIAYKGGLPPMESDVLHQIFYIDFNIKKFLFFKKEKLTDSSKKTIKSFLLESKNKTYFDISIIFNSNKLYSNEKLKSKRIKKILAELKRNKNILKEDIKIIGQDFGATNFSFKIEVKTR